MEIRKRTLNCFNHVDLKKLMVFAFCPLSWLLNCGCNDFVALAKMKFSKTGIAGGLTGENHKYGK